MKNPLIASRIEEKWGEPMSLIMVIYRSVGGRQFTRVWLTDWVLHHRQRSLPSLATGSTLSFEPEVTPVKAPTGNGFCKSVW